MVLKWLFIGNTGEKTLHIHYSFLRTQTYLIKKSPTWKVVLQQSSIDDTGEET